MIMFTFKMLFLGPGGVLGWVLMRVAVPCGFWVRHSCVCAGWWQDCVCCSCINMHESLSSCQIWPCSCPFMCLLVFIQWVHPGLLVSLWEFEEWQVWWLSSFLKAGWFESWMRAAIHLPVMGAQGTWASSHLLLFLPWGMPVSIWAIFPSVPQQFCPLREATEL